MSGIFPTTACQPWNSRNSTSPYRDAVVRYTKDAVYTEGVCALGDLDDEVYDLKHGLARL